MLLFFELPAEQSWKKWTWSCVLFSFYGTHEHYLSVLWVKTEFTVCRKILMSVHSHRTWWSLFFSIVLNLSCELWFNGQCLLCPNYLISFFVAVAVVIVSGRLRPTSQHFYSDLMLCFSFHAAVMSWICTGAGEKLAQLPCWIWKFSCPTFAPLNNDYVVQLRAFLLPFRCCFLPPLRNKSGERKVEMKAGNKKMK